MGKTAFRGPVYGAKANLLTFGPYTGTSSGASTGLFTANSNYVLPGYEDWIITEAFLTASTNSSVAAAHSVYIKSKGGSTVGITPRDIAVGNGSTRAQTIFTLTNAAGSTTWSTWATATADPGEYEGAWVPAGSSLRIVSSGVSLIGLLQINIIGFRRYINSTRAEA